MNDSDNSEQFSSDLDDASKRVAEESDQRKNEDSEIAPFSRQELQKAYVRPYLAIEYILGGRDRLAANLLRGHKLGMVAALLLLTSLFSPIPFGAVPPTNSCLKISILFTGSLFICLPCLHVFSQFLGISLSMTQNLSLALIVSSVAGLFSFGFFPIIWFIDYSTQAVSESIFPTAGISVFLLAFALLMGVIQMLRCVHQRDDKTQKMEHLPFILPVWILLLVFITYRMATVLKLF